MPGGLATDLYELNMAASYLRRGMTGPATFSLYVRDLPPTRGFLVAAGLDDCLSYLERFSFDTGELAWLASHGFTSGDVDAFSRLRFTGDVWAVPEGRVVLAGEPLLEVTASLPEAQLVETALLNIVTFQTAVASKAARCVVAAGDAALVDFAFRRTQGFDAAMAVARVSSLVGFAGTSNVEAARRYGLTVSGTMAHSYVQAFPAQIDAFRAFAHDFPDRPTFLVDTYDTIEGSRDAIRVIRELGLEDRAAVRLDSGDVATLARSVRSVLDREGLGSVRIVASGGLDELAIESLRRGGVPVDAYGVGTTLGVSADAPYLDSVYKLVEHDGRPVLKLSAGKATLPGRKQVFRSPGTQDTIGTRHEDGPPGAEPLLSRVFRAGRSIGEPPSPEAGRARFRADLDELPPGALDLRAPQAPVPAVSAALRELDERVRAKLGR